MDASCSLVISAELISLYDQCKVLLILFFPLPADVFPIQPLVVSGPGYPGQIAQPAQRDPVPFRLQHRPDQLVSGPAGVFFNSPCLLFL